MDAHARRWMRTAATCGLLTVALASTGAAQFTAGVKGGLSVANFTGNDVAGTRWQPGIATGLFMTYNFVENLALQPELLYVQKGAKFDITSDDQRFTADFLLDYIEVPVLVRLNVPLPARRTSVHLMAGPSVAFKSSCEVRTSVAGETSIVDCNDSELDLQVKDLDLNLVGGLGVSVSLPDATFFLEGRYHVGLMTIDDSSPADDVYTQVFTIMGGVSIPLGRRPVLTAHR